MLELEVGDVGLAEVDQVKVQCSFVNVKGTSARQLSHVGSTKLVESMTEAHAIGLVDKPLEQAGTKMPKEKLRRRSGGMQRIGSEFRHNDG